MSVLNCKKTLLLRPKIIKLIPTIVKMKYGDDSVTEYEQWMNMG
jgi:hypothetical protein